MPTVTVRREISLDQAAKSLQDQLGNRYHVTQHAGGAAPSLTVKHSALSWANVRLTGTGDATTFHVHGGGLIVNRLINEFGISRRVAGAIEDEFGASA